MTTETLAVFSSIGDSVGFIYVDTILEIIIIIIMIIIIIIIIMVKLKNYCCSLRCSINHYILCKINLAIGPSTSDLKFHFYGIKIQAPILRQGFPCTKITEVSNIVAVLT